MGYRFLPRYSRFRPLPTYRPQRGCHSHLTRAFIETVRTSVYGRKKEGEMAHQVATDSISCDTLIPEEESSRPVSTGVVRAPARVGHIPTGDGRGMLGSGN